ncbi:MAG: ANTAR domain-containing protein [Angelakisella sp.]|nr:ANTAR domain-containing protein [Angelakisella sp.]
MARALIIAGGDKGRDMLTQVLNGMQMVPAAILTSGAEARRSLTGKDFDLVLINTPLTDEFGLELAVFAAEATGAGVVVLVKAEMADEAAARVEDAGVFVVAKPLNRTLLYGALKLALAVHRRMAGLQKQNSLLQSKIEEIRLVDRAKCALIQYRQMTEPEAHKYIERQAMDTRQSRRRIAEDILQTFEGGC